MARLDHPNIVRVYGGCMTPPNIFVVAELMEGDLNNLIHPKDRGAKCMTLQKSLAVALDVIRGLVRRV